MARLTSSLELNPEDTVPLQLHAPPEDVAIQLHPTDACVLQDLHLALVGVATHECPEDRGARIALILRWGGASLPAAASAQSWCQCTCPAARQSTPSREEDHPSYLIVLVVGCALRWHQKSLVPKCSLHILRLLLRIRHVLALDLDEGISFVHTALHRGHRLVLAPLSHDVRHAGEPLAHLRARPRHQSEHVERCRRRKLFADAHGL
mmetsp:Transcript_90568/g.293182  ORF Transcript_90568/g.293182 Transcript_90568/m.293182 type:complete len:207 (-) Transcript_90568:122-742(-)